MNFSHTFIKLAAPRLDLEYLFKSNNSKSIDLCVFFPLIHFPDIYVSVRELGMGKYRNKKSLCPQLGLQVKNMCVYLYINISQVIIPTSGFFFL